MSAPDVREAAQAVVNGTIAAIKTSTAWRSVPRELIDALRAALAAPSGGDATPRDEAVALLADARKCVVLANANGYYDVWLSRCDRVLGGAR